MAKEKRDAELLVERLLDGGLPALDQPSHAELRNMRRAVLKKSAPRNIRPWALGASLAGAAAAASIFVAVQPESMPIKGDGASVAPVLLYPLVVESGEAKRLVSTADSAMVEIASSATVQWIATPREQGEQNLSLSYLLLDDSGILLEAQTLPRPPSESPIGNAIALTPYEGELWLVGIVHRETLSREDLSSIAERARASLLDRGGGKLDETWVALHRLRVIK